jgi:hypothetical protein
MTQTRLTFSQLGMAQRRLNAISKGGNTDETRRSWAVGEIMLAHPEMSREQAEQIVDSVLQTEKRENDRG